MKSYKDLDIYNISFDLFIMTHRFSMKLPKFELYELGSQVRRSANSVPSNIVEGYGRRRYKADFIRFLVYAHSSCLETLSHLAKISILYPELQEEAVSLNQAYEQIGGKTYNFIEYVEKNWR